MNLFDDINWLTISTASKSLLHNFNPRTMLSQTFRCSHVISKTKAFRRDLMRHRRNLKPSNIVILILVIVQYQPTSLRFRFITLILRKVQPLTIWFLEIFSSSLLWIHIAMSLVKARLSPNQPQTNFESSSLTLQENYRLTRVRIVIVMILVLLSTTIRRRCV